MRKLLLVMLLAHLTGFGQNSRVTWWVLDMGSGSSAATGMELQSAVGQNFVGWVRQGNTMVIGGFLTDTLFRGVGVSVAESHDLPLTYDLKQNYPNPFNPTATISYQLPTQSHVMLKVYDVIGREVATLVNEVKPAGRYEVQFNGSGLASGVYFYRLQAGSFVEVKKMVLLK